ncbi:hypothetical protein PG1513B_0802 [Bifidobacterium pseudolongum subsp. pseudolongum]|uniref:hypothetical protein n=1 Tax=Bifidobacterium pseudolongum TaxID=1694 RepID=UPI0010CFC03D|nr:hypothetical protein [Bifidobacterium pseudolongum]RYQ62954.1 hypothetical protein PG1513B_0802 [Bifidobacterium pseudolongum subsp. pseudolongum]
MTMQRMLPVVATTVLMPATDWLRVSGYADTIGSSFSHAVCALCARGLAELDDPESK